MKNLEKMKKENGYVLSGSTEIILTQMASMGIDRSHGNELTAYFAYGVDHEGNEYEIKWYPHEEWDGEDESIACDWDNPYSIKSV